MVTAPQFVLKSSNQEQLANFRHAPFAQTQLTLVTVSEGQAALSLAAEAERKAQNKAERKAQAAEAKQRQAAERLAQNVSLVGCITALPNEEGLKAVHSFQLRKSGTVRPTATEIPAEVLAHGLAEDRLAEEERCDKEAAQSEEALARKERLRLGYIQDVVKTAIDHLRREDINLEAKVLILEEMGCQYSWNTKNGRDAVYFHQKSGAEILVRGGAIDDSSHQGEAKSPTSSVDRAKREAKRENNRAERLAAQPPKGKGGQKDQPGSGKKKKDAK